MLSARRGYPSLHFYAQSRARSFAAKAAPGAAIMMLLKKSPLCDRFLDTEF